MSGYCSGCGNTLCICKLMNSNVSIEEHHKTYEELYFESLKVVGKLEAKNKHLERQINSMREDSKHLSKISCEKGVRIKTLEAKNKQQENNLNLLIDSEYKKNSKISEMDLEILKLNNDKFELFEKNERLEKLLIEACIFIRENQEIDLVNYGANDYDQEQFLNKPEIKELLERNEKDSDE